MTGPSLDLSTDPRQDDAGHGWVGVTCYGCSHGDWQGAGARAQEYPPHGWPTDDDGRKWGIVGGEWYCPDDAARLAMRGFTVDFARMRR